MTIQTQEVRMTTQQWLEFVLQFAAPVLWSCVILLIAYFLSSWARRLVINACERAKIEPTLARFFAKLTRWVILILAGTFVLNRFGFETAGFSVLVGAVGLAIGLAFQGTLSNFASGIMLMIFRPYKIGDLIVAAGQTGTVYEIDLFSTTLDTVDNKRIFIPNTAIFGTVITNISFHQRRRIDVVVMVQHDGDIDATRKALTTAASKVTGRLAEPPEVVLLDMTTSGVSWQVQVWAPAADFLKVRQATMREIKVALDEARIALALAQQTTPIR